MNTFSAHIIHAAEIKCYDALLRDSDCDPSDSCRVYEDCKLCQKTRIKGSKHA